MRYTNALDIRVASSDHDVSAVRTLWLEYWQSLGLPADFQNFSEEMASLPGLYAAPRGRLLLALKDGVLAGAGAFRPLDAQACEAKRLYVPPQFRRLGIASALLERLIHEACRTGYKYMYGDTLPSMESALQLYRRVGFQEIPPYSSAPTPGAIYLRLALNTNVCRCP